MSKSRTTVPAPASRRREVERGSRRRFVLERARAVFAAKGVENTSMDDLAVAAEYTRRTLYAYFTSRDDICLQVHLEDLEQRWQAQRAALARAGDGLSGIRIWAETLQDFWRRNPHAMQLERYWDYRGVDRSRLDPRVFRRFELLNEELASGLRDLFRRGIADGSLRPDLEIDMAISHFLYALRAVLGRALSTTHSFARFDADAYVSEFLDLYLRGVGSGRGAAAS